MSGNYVQMFSRRVKSFLLFSLLVSIVIIVQMNLNFLSNEDEPVKLTRVHNPGQSRKKPIILLWDNYFGGEWPRIHLPCNCTLTRDRSFFNSSSAVVFHLRDFHIRDVPDIHLQHQKFVMYNLESPCYSRNNKRDFELFQDNIDWSMTYRSDSDIYTPYAAKVAKSDSSIKYKMSNRYMEMNLFNSKTRKVAWFVSNCDTCSKREQFVEDLKKHISVDTYGSCGSLKCSERVFCYQMLESDHKFYLSFENSICKEYITEKLFNILAYHIIPVVLGPTEDYKKVLPENSYIDALNFSSPKMLADFLNRVAGSERLYSSFFDWKDYYSFKPILHKTHFCKLCSKLNAALANSPSSGKKRRDLVNWWYADGQCSTWRERTVVDQDHE